VLAHDRFERREITAAHGRENLSVLLLRLVDAMHEDAAEEIAPDAVPSREHALRHFREHLQARQRADREMEARIHRGPLRVAPGRDRAVHVGDELRERVDLPGVCALGDEPRGDDFEPLEHCEHILNRFGRDRRHRRAGVRHGDDEALGLEHLDGFANGDGTDLEPPGEIVDHQPLAGAQIAAHDRVAQRLIGELLLGAVSPVTLDGYRHVRRFL